MPFCPPNTETGPFSPKAIGKRLRKLRIAAGMSQKDLGYIVYGDREKGRGILYAVERGTHRMQLDTAWNIAVGVGCSLDDLLPTGFPPRERLPQAADCSKVTIGVRLRELRTLAGLSLKALADLAGYPDRGVWHTENAIKRIKFPSAHKVCMALQISFEDWLPTGNTPRAASSE